MAVDASLVKLRLAHNASIAMIGQLQLVRRRLARTTVVDVMRLNEDIAKLEALARRMEARMAAMNLYDDDDVS